MKDLFKSKVFITLLSKKIIDSKKNDINLTNIKKFVELHRSGDFGEITLNEAMENLRVINKNKGLVTSFYKINKKARNNYGNKKEIFIVVTRFPDCITTIYNSRDYR